MNYQDYCPNCSYQGCVNAEKSAAEKLNYVRCPYFKYTDENGAQKSMVFYKELPAGMRVAKRSDFIDDREVEIVNMSFLALSFHSGRYEHHISRPGMLEKWKPWLEADHIFVKTINHNLTNTGIWRAGEK